MKALLKLNNPFWKTPERRQILDKAVQQSAAELEAKIKQKILESSPAGKTYARGNIFHRASRKGQPPAVFSGSLLISIRAKKLGELKSSVSTSKNYAPRLDNKNKLDRPFFESTAEAYKAQFKQNLTDAIREAGVKTT